MSTKTKTAKAKSKRTRSPRAAGAVGALQGGDGETTKSPNKKFLVRRIEGGVGRARRRARARRGAAAPDAHQRARDVGARARDDARREHAAEAARSVRVDDDRGAADEVPEVVGRSTGSDDRRYLIWKIREAEKGRINVGPRKTRARDGEPLEVKILPLRLEADVADKMDEAWRAKGIKNRMEFFRGPSVTTSRISARDAAALFTNAGATGRERVH